MDLSAWLWLCLAAYAVHILEEHALNWRDWARSVIKLPVEWSDFYVTNAVVVVLGVAAAGCVSGFPAVALGFPALMIINAILFHIVPVIRTKGRFSPGLFTAVVLFLPLGWLTMRRALQAGVVDAAGIFLAFVIGALLMATPIILLRIASLPYFQQDRP